MNRDADFYASHSHEFKSLVPQSPIPTFHMNEYTFYRDGDGWIESDIGDFINVSMALEMSTKLGIGNKYRMSTWAHDQSPTCGRHLPIWWLYSSTRDPVSSRQPTYLLKGARGFRAIGAGWDAMKWKTCTISLCTARHIRNGEQRQERASLNGQRKSLTRWKSRRLLQITSSSQLSHSSLMIHRYGRYRKHSFI